MARVHLCETLLLMGPRDDTYFGTGGCQLINGNNVVLAKDFHKWKWCFRHFDCKMGIFYVAYSSHALTITHQRSV